MKEKCQEQDQLSDSYHKEILDNLPADILSRVATYVDYVLLGFSKKEAKDLAGVSINQLNQHPEMLSRI